MQRINKLGRGDYVGEAPQASSFSPDKQGRYIAYPKALRQLQQRLGAMPEELAAWVFMGPENGGIAAYRNANELNPPPRFHFDYFMGEDYLGPMMACWFLEDDIENFTPADRYITGKVLIERWDKQPGVNAVAYIQAKIDESRLFDLHPIYGGTRGTFSENHTFPSLEVGLFALADVKGIEVEDFGSAVESIQQHTAIDHRYSPSNARREARKLNTQAMYRSWRKEYRILKKKRPGMSDVWYAQQIAKMEVAQGREADTIRKNMKK